MGLVKLPAKPPGRLGSGEPNLWTCFYPADELLGRQNDSYDLTVVYVGFNYGSSDREAKVQKGVYGV